MIVKIIPEPMSDKAIMKLERERQKAAAKVGHDEPVQVTDFESECEPHVYEERPSGVRCVKCGHFVGNWE